MPIYRSFFSVLTVSLFGVFFINYCLTPSPAHSVTTYFSDTFTRTASGSVWGPSTSGHSYSISNSTSYSVNGSEGVISTAAGQTLSANINTLTQTNIEASIKFKINQLPATANDSFSIVTRNVGSNNYYRSKLILTTAGTILVNFSSLSAGTETDMSSNTTVPGITLQTNTYYWVKTQIEGTSPTTLRVRVWQDGTDEPTNWLKTATNSQANLQTAGLMGIQTYVSGSSSVTPIVYTFDDFTITSIPTFTPFSEASDSFSRTTVSSWGNASVTGGTYSLVGGSTSDYAVSGGVGTMTTPTGNSNHRAYLTSVSMLDSDQLVKFKSDKVAVGGSMYVNLLSRADGTGANEYFFQIIERTTNVFDIRICKLVSSAETCLSSEHRVPYATHTADGYMWMRFQTSGSSPTTLKAKLWEDGWKEPLDWQTTATDSESILQSASYIGLKNFVGSGATNTPIVFTFDDYTASTTMTNTAADVSGSKQDKGVTWHIGSWYGTTNAPTAYYWRGIYDDLAKMRAAGITNARLTMNMNTQTVCDNKKFYSGVRDALDNYGITPLITITIPNATSTTATTEQRNTFKSWLNTMVNCYKDDFDYWEVGNEPNLTDYWNIDDDPASDQTAYEQSVEWYYDYLEDAYTTIKAADSGATVIHAGLSQYKLDRWLVASALQDRSGIFDAMGFHPYSDYGSEGSLNQLNKVYKWLNNTPGLSSKPIWITEVGYTDKSGEYPGNVANSTIKASYLTETLQDLRNWGITTPIFWYDFTQNAANPTEGYPLIISDRSALTSNIQPAYTAMQNLWSESIADLPDLAISDVEASVSSNQSTITWNTNLISSGQIRIGPSSTNGRNRNPVDSTTMFFDHTDTISGLQPCTTYYYTITSTDVDSNTDSYEDSFSTNGCVGSSSVLGSTIADVTNTNGGNIELRSDGKGISLRIPSGYSNDSATFQIKKLAKDIAFSDIGKPSGNTLIGSYVYDLKAVKDDLSLIGTFDKKLTIKIFYKQSEVESIDEDDLKIQRWDGTKWTRLSGCSLDKANNEISCETKNFSVFALFVDNENDDSVEECEDDVGIQPSWLYAAIPQDTSSILLQFTEAADPVEYYSLEYGTSTNNYNETKEDIGIESKSKMEYLVKNLSPNSTYYFRIRGNNGCKSGEWSNEIKAKTHGFGGSELNTLNIISSKLEAETITNADSVVTKADDTEANTQTDPLQEKDYKVKIKVLNEEGSPVEGAKVTMHSKVQEATTDKEGIAYFENVEHGDHRVIIAYNGYEGEQALNLDGDVKEFSLEIKIKEQSVLSSPTYLWSMGIALIIISILSIIIFLRRR